MAKEERLGGRCRHCYRVCVDVDMQAYKLTLMKGAKLDVSSYAYIVGSGDTSKLKQFIPCVNSASSKMLVATSPVSSLLLAI